MNFAEPVRLVAGGEAARNRQDVTVVQQRGHLIDGIEDRLFVLIAEHEDRNLRAFFLKRPAGVVFAVAARENRNQNADLRAGLTAEVILLTLLIADRAASALRPCCKPDRANQAFPSRRASTSSWLSFSSLMRYCGSAFTSPITAARSSANCGVTSATINPGCSCRSS